MRTLLNGVRDWLQTEWPHVEVARRPDDVPDGMPYATVWLTTGIPEHNTATPDDIDLSQTSIVHVKAIGSSHDQAGLLSDRLHHRIRDGLTIDSLAVHLVRLDRTAGPTRDDDVHPAPNAFYADRWYEIWTAPTPN